jgi:hypothetical protein
MWFSYGGWAYFRHRVSVAELVVVVVVVGVMMVVVVAAAAAV